VAPVHEQYKASDGQTHPQIKIKYAKCEKTTNLRDHKGNTPEVDKIINNTPK